MPGEGQADHGTEIRFWYESPHYHHESSSRPSRLRGVGTLTEVDRPSDH